MRNVSEIMIQVKELFENLARPNLKILCVKIDPIGPATPSLETAKYIPGSVVFDIEALSDHSLGLPHMMPDLSQFESQVRKLGINQGDEIVVYDEKGIYSSPRARYMFLNAGFSNVRVLDGGVPEWLKAGYQVVDSQLVPDHLGDFKVGDPIRKFVNQDFVLAAIGSRSIELIDARSGDRYHGRVPEPRVGLRRGHIPTALSVPFTDCLDGGRLKNVEKLRELFKSSLSDSRPKVFYCGSGVTACVTALAAEVAGVEQISVYDGSWSEWGQESGPRIE